MQQEYKVYITETVIRTVWVAAETPADAQRTAEENYNEQDITNVGFEVDPAYGDLHDVLGYAGGNAKTEKNILSAGSTATQAGHMR